MERFDFSVSRRILLGTALAMPAIRLAQAATQITFKLGNDLPVSHPLNTRLQAAAQTLSERSDGRIALRVFPNNQLGSDTDMLSQLRSGAVEMLSLSGNILSTMLPIAGMYNLPFAFPDYEHVWSAMDGDFGNYLRGKVSDIGIHSLDKHWDNGFRQITSGVKRIDAPADLKGFKIRVPVSPLWLSLFSALGAAPTSINFSETYSALQTHVVDGQENALPVVFSAKLYEVQKYAAVTNHMWDGFYMLVGHRAWERLPDDLRTILASTLDEAAMAQRQEMAELNNSLEAQLTELGMQFNRPDITLFRAALTSAGFYVGWQKKFGDEAWSKLEHATGTLG